ncbi:DUF3221 domain-containing protein [Aquibacillus salsiterrae]|uniref:YobA family protein n=1 Tax=Aquibacillus salsiterrae TaxID=2950439 RepID=A0A9X3WG95_9BACI|nr:DUF3221 domain-containing protein [Aquibacillus salsiterrae]MDC3418098.1 YobA family protein [Aquibacillus salsiterrae]
MKESTSKFNGTNIKVVRLIYKGVMILKRLNFFILSLVFVTLLTGCGNSSGNGMEENEVRDLEENIVEETGIVSLVKDDGRVQVLLIPNVTKEQIEGKDERQINNLAQKNNGAWYSIKEGRFEVGQEVKVYYNANQEQLDSNPPQRGAEKIEVIEE